MRLRNLMMVVLGCIACAIAFLVFLSPFHLVPGGVSGIAIILNYLFNIEESLSVFLLSVMLLLISLIFLDKETTVKSILGSLLLPAFIYLFGLLFTQLHIEITDRLLASIFGGICFGFGIGLVYKAGYTTGGSDIIVKIIHKYFHLSLGASTFIIDGLITITGVFVFGLEVFIYSIITVYITSIVINKVMMGIFGNKSFYIITSHPDEIVDYISKELGHGATILDGKGAFSNKKQSIILTVIPTSDYYKLKDGISMYDKEAFFTVCDSYEVGGGK